MNESKRIPPALIHQPPFIMRKRQNGGETRTVTLSKTDGDSPYISLNESKSSHEPQITSAFHKEDKENFSVPIGELPNTEEIEEAIPKDYSFLDVLGHGEFGLVFQCEEKNTHNIVSVKLSHCKQKTQKEVDLMTIMMKRDLDQHNIIKFYKSVDTDFGKVLVFERLDISLANYLDIHHPKPMRIQSIKFIVQQMVNALRALKTMKIIHTDVTMNSIMLCDQTTHPLRVKLTNFGSAIFGMKAIPGLKVQSVDYRSPEVILGLPFTEAIDVWSLGTVMANMLLGFKLFPHRSDFETLKIMVKHFGQPLDYTLDTAMRTHRYFNTNTSSYQLMSNKEYEQYAGLSHGTIKTYHSELFDSLDLMIEQKNRKDVQECLPLLHHMLKMEAAQRITPDQILRHPVICKAPFYVPLKNPTPATPMNLRPTAYPYISTDSTRIISQISYPDCFTRVVVPKTKKKRTHIEHFSSWIRRNFCCMLVEIDDE